MTSGGVLFYNIQLKGQLVNFRITQHYELLPMGGIRQSYVLLSYCFNFQKNCPNLLQTICIFVGLTKGVGNIKWSLVKSQLSTYVESKTSQRAGKCYKETS